MSIKNADIRNRTRDVPARNALPQLIVPPRDPNVNANNTVCSQTVSHPSTNHAKRCLTAVIGREPALSALHVRWQGIIHGTHKLTDLYRKCEIKSQKN